jgi:hypothetical protein
MATAAQDATSTAVAAVSASAAAGARATWVRESMPGEH